MSYRPLPRKHASLTQKFADDRRHRGTEAELELERILNRVNGGVLRGRFQREWAFGGHWIIDFYFPEIRLGIEVDGGYHRSIKQQLLDIERELYLEKSGITIKRLENEMVFGDREALLEKLRDAWRSALVSYRKFSLRSNPVKKRQLAPSRPMQRHNHGQGKPYSGGWISLDQGVAKMGDAFQKAYVNEGISGSRDEQRIIQKQQSFEMRKRSRGE